jgi:hypothetical protein
LHHTDWPSHLPPQEFLNTSDTSDWGTNDQQQFNNPQRPSTEYDKTEVIANIHKYCPCIIGEDTIINSQRTLIKEAKYGQKNLGHLFPKPGAQPTG